MNLAPALKDFYAYIIDTWLNARCNFSIILTRYLTQFLNNIDQIFDAILYPWKFSIYVECYIDSTNTIQNILDKPNLVTVTFAL